MGRLASTAVAGVAAVLLLGSASSQPNASSWEPEPEPEPEGYTLLQSHTADDSVCEHGSCAGTNKGFFSFYEFVQWTWDKRTHGTVSYISQSAATSKKMIDFPTVGNGEKRVRWGVDNRTTLSPPPPPGSHRKASERPSMRIHSKTEFDLGEDKPLRSLLVAIDLTHIPTGCGTWPAFWLDHVNKAGDPLWPHFGEIDIIEGTNAQDGCPPPTTGDADDNGCKVHTTLHTCGPASAATDGQKGHKNQCKGSTQCTMKDVPASNFTGQWAKASGGNPSNNCDVDASGQYSNQGCSVLGEQGSYGAAFNAAKGGLFVLEWSVKDEAGGHALDTPHIAAWFFPRSALPLPYFSGDKAPDTKDFPKPYAYFPLGDNCDPSHFKQERIVFDTTLCGDDAGNKWVSSGCAAKHGTPGTDPVAECEAFVRSSPHEFSEAYWELNHVSVWGELTGVPFPSPAPAPKPPAASSELMIIVIVVVAALGACLVAACGWKCYNDRQPGYDRSGLKARLRDTGDWEPTSTYPERQEVAAAGEKAMRSSGSTSW